MHEFSNTAVEHSGFYSDGDDPNHHCSRTEASSSTFFFVQVLQISLREHHKIDI